jgi:CspA family cold shock protein
MQRRKFSREFKIEVVKLVIGFKREKLTWLWVLLSVQCSQGFWIYPTDNGGNDVFGHISAVERAGFRTLNEGTKVSYEVKENWGKMSAENLRVG